MPDVIDPVVTTLAGGTWSVLLPKAVKSALLMGKRVTAELTPVKVSSTGKTVTFHVDALRRS